MLNSKELLEKTGISRATLNNYIALGIVPKPDVLPPGPQDGAAPRLGYFPEGTVERIAEVQRLKNSGWSMAAIAEHFGADRAATARAEPIPPIARAAAARTDRASPEGMREPPQLSLPRIAEPAYLVDHDFVVLWSNAASESLPGGHEVGANVLQPFVAAGAQHEVLRFHLSVAKQQGLQWSRLAALLPVAQRSDLQELFERTDAAGPGRLWHRQLEIRGAAVCLYAVQFREGTLFVQAPRGRVGEELSAILATGDTTAAPVAPRRRPVLSDVAVLAMDLHDATRIWSALPAEEYFELIDQVWLATEPVLRRHHGISGKHPGDGIVAYFMPQSGASHAWNALLAAHEVREAMRRVSKEWQLRKGWSTELYMNSGLDEGQQWLGSVRSGGRSEFTTFGDPLNRATRISDFARFGAVWATKSLIMKLAPAQRERLQYGVQRRDRDGRHRFVPAVFTTIDRLADAASLPARLQDIARLPITELVDIPAAPVRRPVDAHPN